MSGRGNRDRVRSTNPTALLTFVFVSFVVTAPIACNSAATSVDLIVRGDHVVTMDDGNSVISDGAVAVADGMIVAVGPYADVARAYKASAEIDGTNKVLMPGLINGHTHAAMSLLRGIADDLNLRDWLYNYIFPAEVKFVDEEFVRIGTELACWEFIRGGTTTFVDMYYFPDSVANAVEDCGLRVLVAPSVIDQKAPDADGFDESLRLAVDFVERWKGRNNRIIPIIGAHSAYTVNPEQLKEVRRQALELDVPVSIHLSEISFEVEFTTENYGKTPVHHLESLDFFSGPTIGAHVVWPTESEIPVLAQRRVGVIHNPTSNMKISSGISPVTEMLAQGVPLGLGTDGAASNNDLDMWEEMRLAAFLQKVGTMDPEALPATAVLNMATRGGAAAIGLGDEIGSLTVGRRADMIQVSLTDVHFVPTYDVISHLVYVADEQDVSTVVVDGKVLMRGGQILTLDTDRVRKESVDLAARIQAALEPGQAGN